MAMEPIPTPPTWKGPDTWFTGDTYVTPLTGQHEGTALSASLVHFAPGARTRWHSHDRGQLLHGSDGVGLVVTRDGRALRIRPGASVWTPPGEEHWHGALEDTLMSHYAMLDGNEDGSDPTHWLEPVSDEQYRAAHDTAED